MERFDDKYVNIHTDFGFKRIFGTEFNKELLISFLNALLDGEQVIRDVHYLNNEHLGESIGSRKAIFDVFCENEHGEKFIVEMQNVYQKFFKDRSIYYATFPIREQAHPGDWDFHLKSVYTVGLLNFVLDDDRYSDDCFHHEVKLMDVEKKTVFYDKLTFIYVEIPKFNKTEQELVSMFDKWMYVLKNLSRLMRRPAALQERVFTRLFEQAEIAKLSHHELQQYESDMKAYRDIVNAIRTARLPRQPQERDRRRHRKRTHHRQRGRTHDWQRGRTHDWQRGRTHHRQGRRAKREEGRNRPEAESDGRTDRTNRRHHRTFYQWGQRPIKDCSSAFPITAVSTISE